MSNTTLAAVLARTSHVLLDFDGPICSVFSSLTPAAVARALRTRLNLSGSIETEEPFEILEWVASNKPSFAIEAEAQLTRLEVEAVATATPTLGAVEVLQHFAKRGRQVVVVSNNSAVAVEGYLTSRDLLRYVVGVSARVKPDPGLLKPNPYLLQQAIKSLGVLPQKCVMVGDSKTDVEAARAAAVPAIAFANKPGKRERLASSQPDSIIDQMTELLLLSS